MRGCKVKKFIQEFAVGLLFGFLGYMLFAVRQENWKLSEDIAWLAGFSLGTALIFGLISLSQSCKEENNDISYAHTVGGSRKGNFIVGFIFGFILGFIGYFMYATLQERIFSIAEALVSSLIGGLILGFILSLDKGVMVKEDESVTMQYLGLFGQKNYGNETKINPNQTAYLPLVFGILSVVYALTFEKYSFASVFAVLGGFRYGIKILNFKNGLSLPNILAVFGMISSLVGLWLVL